nr:MAG TPA: hypothetical protein [Crassvirales sp.]
MSRAKHVYLFINRLLMLQISMIYMIIRIFIIINIIINILIINIVNQLRGNHYQ